MNKFTVHCNNANMLQVCKHIHVHAHTKKIHKHRRKCTEIDRENVTYSELCHKSKKKWKWKTNRWRTPQPPLCPVHNTWAICRVRGAVIFLHLHHLCYYSLFIYFISYVSVLSLSLSRSLSLSLFLSSFIIITQIKATLITWIVFFQ